MIPGIVAGQMRASGAAPVLWTPLNMATVPQIYLDAQDSVVTDVSGACSAISNLGAMGADGDFSQGTADNRPGILAAELNGNRVLSFDGSNDLMISDSTAARAMLNAAAAVWSFAVYKKRSTDVTDTTRYLINHTTSSGASRYFHAISRVTAGGANKQGIFIQRIDGGSTATLLAATAKSATYAMGFADVNLSTRAGRIYVDGALDASNATLTDAVGAFSATNGSVGPTIGARSDGAFAADMDLAAIVASNTTPPDTDIDKLFGWAAHKYGLTASLPGGHPYKTVAPTV